MARSTDLIDAVADENMKVGAGAPAHYAASAMQGHAAHQNRLNIIAENSLANALLISGAAAAAAARTFTETDPKEAMSDAILGQQGAKVAQSTPPETAGP